MVWTGTLTGFARERNRIGSKLFQHKNMHKVTLRAPDSKAENWIDRVLEVKHVRFLTDIKSYRGADANGDDTYLNLVMNSWITKHLEREAGKCKMWSTENGLLIWQRKKNNQM